MRNVLNVFFCFLGSIAVHILLIMILDQTIFKKIISIMN
jgi:hypothetical protein